MSSSYPILHSPAYLPNKPALTITQRCHDKKWNTERKMFFLIFINCFLTIICVFHLPYYVWFTSNKSFSFSFHLHRSSPRAALFKSKIVYSQWVSTSSKLSANGIHGYIVFFVIIIFFLNLLSNIILSRMVLYLSLKCRIRWCPLAEMIPPAVSLLEQDSADCSGR